MYLPESEWTHFQISKTTAIRQVHDIAISDSLVDDTVRRIESGLFLPHSGIRFPQNPCTTCPFLGLCLDQRDLVEAGLIRKPGVDLGLFDELAY